MRFQACLHIACLSLISTSFASLLACGEVTRVWTSWPTPTDSEASTAIIGAQVESELQIHVASVSDGELDYILDLPPQEAEQTAIEVVFYSTPFDRVGLSGGRLSSASALNGSTPLAKGDGRLFSEPVLGAFRAEWDQRRLEWKSNGRASDALATFRTEIDQRPCPFWGSATLQEQLPFEFNAATLLDDRRVVVFSAGDEMAIVETDRVEFLPEQRRFYRDMITFEDRVIVGDGFGQVQFGRASAEEIITDGVSLGPPLEGPIRSLVGTSTTDLFAWIGMNQLLHYDGNQWNALGEVPRPEGPIQLLGRGQALFPTQDGTLLHWLSPSGIRVETSAFDGGVLSAATVPGVGTIVGTDTGAFFRDQGAGWNLIPNSQFGWWAVDIQPDDGGFAYLLASGLAGYFHPGHGFCPDLVTAILTSKGRLLMTDVDIVVVAKVPGGALTQVFRFPRFAE